MTSLAPARQRPSNAPALAALVVGAVALGVSPIFVRLADVGPLTSAFWRVCVAVPALFVWMKLSEPEASGPAPRRFGLQTMLAGLAFSGDLIFWHLSLLRTSIANATFFATSAPLWVVLFGWLFFRERVGRRVLFGLALCLVGGVALVQQSVQLAAGHTIGDMLGMMAGALFSIYLLIGRTMRETMSAARLTFETSVVAAVVLGIVAYGMEPRFLPRSVSGWEAVIGLGLIAQVGGQGFMSVALGRLPAVFSSLVIFLEAIVAALVAWAALGEAVTAAQASGGVLILIGIVIARPREDARSSSK